MKVYVVNTTWANDCECESIYGSGIDGVYTSEEQAIARLNEIVSEEYKNNYDLERYEVERTDTTFAASEQGSFTNAHFCVFISERELNEGE